nr:hypothetical protein [Micromonospora sp. DSM 115978]
MRRGEADRVEAVRTIVKRRRRPAAAESVAGLVRIVWSGGLPTAAEALALLDLIKESGVGSIANTSLAETFIEVMIADAQSRDGLTDADGRLASRMYQDAEVAGSLSRAAEQIAKAVYLGWYFRQRPPVGREAALAAGGAVQMYP